VLHNEMKVRCRRNFQFVSLLLVSSCAVYRPPLLVSAFSTLSSVSLLRKVSSSALHSGLKYQRVCTTTPQYLINRNCLSTMSAGLLSICQQDSYLKRSVNRVVSCSPSTVVANEFEVVLEDSVLYPEGGGQPSDFGTLNGVPVTSVEKFTGENPGTYVKVTLSKPVEMGTDVESVVDWDRRFDHMQQHTAQHLLSGVANKLFSLETVGWNLGSDYVTVDLCLPGGGLLSEEQIAALESAINAEIRRGAAVNFVVKSRDDVASGVVAEDAGSEIAIRGAPKGAASELESLRLVCIAGLDANPCGGDSRGGLICFRQGMCVMD
jgi:Ser-tRNA(Ala) deacylase AlaX